MNTMALRPSCLPCCWAYLSSFYRSRELALLGFRITAGKIVALVPVALITIVLAVAAMGTSFKDVLAIGPKAIVFLCTETLVRKNPLVQGHFPAREASARASGQSAKAGRPRVHPGTPVAGRLDRRLDGHDGA